jgi:tetratricopeptide (TPR) repeat protein
MKPTGKIALIVCVVALALAAGSFAFASSSAAPLPQRHPAYLHALSDLRFARALLDRPDGGELHQQEKDARHELDKAIDEIKKAAAYDGKDLNDHPPVDPHLPWVGRLRKALELIDDAHRDVAREEDDPASIGLQQRSLGHIDAARAHVKEAIDIVH